MSSQNPIASHRKFSKTIPIYVFVKFLSSCSFIQNSCHRSENAVHLPNFLIASLKYSKTILKLVFAKVFHRLLENIQRLFRLQNCLSRKSSAPENIKKTFSPAKLSWPQTINILEIFKNFFSCRNVSAAKHQHRGKVQRLFRLQNCLSLKSSIYWKQSKTLSFAKLS